MNCAINRFVSTNLLAIAAKNLFFIHIIVYIEGFGWLYSTYLGFQDLLSCRDFNTETTSRRKMTIHQHNKNKIVKTVPLMPPSKTLFITTVPLLDTNIQQSRDLTCGLCLSHIHVYRADEHKAKPNLLQHETKQGHGDSSQRMRIRNAGCTAHRSLIILNVTRSSSFGTSTGITFHVIITAGMWHVLSIKQPLNQKMSSKIIVFRAATCSFDNDAW